MKYWQTRTSKYFYLIAGAVLASVIIFILIDSYKTRQVKASFSAYMDNLCDMIFMSACDSLKKGDMQLFKNHLEKIGTFEDVKEISLLDTKGVVHFSSDPQFVNQVDTRVIGLEHRQNLSRDGYRTYYFPVETTSDCSSCHTGWDIGAINSYYKLTLSRKTLDNLELGSIYYHGFKVIGGGLFLAFTYLLFSMHEHKRHEEQVLLSASVFENAVEAIAITNFKGQVEKINPAFSLITGFAAEDVLGESIYLLDAGEVNTAAYVEMREQLRANGLWSGEIWNRRKSGESFPVRLSVTAVRNARNRVTHFISIFYDITDIKASHDQLSHQVYHDALTGLPNRRLFSDRLQMALNLAHRHRHAVAILFIDLDDFKAINDSAGHRIGDLLLVEIADRLKKCIREGDTISRFGGDEFVIILPEIVQPEEIDIIIRRLQAEISRPVEMNGQLLATSPSIGVALFPQDGEDTESLIINADYAMYQAKKQGKNLCVWHSAVSGTAKPPGSSGVAEDQAVAS